MAARTCVSSMLASVCLLTVCASAVNMSTVGMDDVLCKRWAKQSERGAERVRGWVEREVRLAQYAPAFVEHGFEYLDDVAFLTMDGLKSMGVDKLGHRIRFMRYVKQLDKKSQHKTTYQPSSSRMSFERNMVGMWTADRELFSEYSFGMSLTNLMYAVVLFHLALIPLTCFYFYFGGSSDTWFSWTGTKKSA